MSTNNIQRKDRLKLYKKALFDYRLSLFLERIKLLKLFPKIDIKTKRGFCLYFLSHGIPLSNLPELYAQRTKHPVGLWFLVGEKKRRIICLKKAIIITKAK